MFDGKVIRLHGDATDGALSTEVKGVSAKVLPLRAVNDRRGQYTDLRAFIDAGRDVEVCVETMD